MGSPIRFVKKFNSERESIKFAKQFGSKLRGGEVIELVGDIGSGKTTFVKGLALGTGSKDHVTSPTFVLQQKYSGQPTIYHYDFYRLNDAGLIAREIEEALNQNDVTVVVEWAHTVKNVLPEARVRITIKPTGETSRQFDVAIPKQLEYLS